MEKYRPVAQTAALVLAVSMFTLVVVKAQGCQRPVDPEPRAAAVDLGTPKPEAPDTAGPAVDAGTAWDATPTQFHVLPATKSGVIHVLPEPVQQQQNAAPE